MGVKIWPKEFEKKEHINKEERFLLRNAVNNLKDGMFVVGIDPLGLSSDITKIGMCISPSNGLVTFSIADGIDENAIASIMQFSTIIEQQIRERLLNSKLLIFQRNGNKLLKFPYKHVFVYPHAKQLITNKNIKSYDDVKNSIMVGFFKPLVKQEKFTDELIKNAFLARSSVYKPLLNELECRAIFERLAPEYTVVLTEKEPVTVLKSSKKDANEMAITGEEVEYKTFFLDDYQVALVNDMGTGHRVILANPGAGKSVLLLSKAFKYASVYKKSKILLTCYNNNLADSYNFKRSCANFGENKNLYIMTFHRLVKKILEECLGVICNSNIVDEVDIQRCIDSIKNGKLKLRFKAVFIDEVQIFEPKYLELCYLLLEESENTTFLMAGDLNQTVRSLSRKGDVPWKKIGRIKLDFNGRVKYIEKNYRNSKEIGEYLKGMLCFMNDKMGKMSMSLVNEFEYNSFTISDKKGIALEIKTGIQRGNIQKEVIVAINELTTKLHIGYSDIAILFPYKDHRSVQYHFLYWVEAALNDAGIPYTVIIPDNKGNTRKRYSQATGVILSTIDSSLGLDFKAVVLAGLFPYNYIFDTNFKFKIDSWDTISSLSNANKEKVQLQIRKVYTACSRARDILYVLSDLNSGSPMEDIINENSW